MSWVQLRRAYFYCIFFFFFRFQTYKCTLHTKQSLYYICYYLSRIYAIRSLSLSHKYFLLYSYLLPFAHLRTRTQILHTKRSHTVSLHVYHIHFAHLLSKKYPLFTSNAIQLYNNLKKCIIYICIKIRGAIARGRTTVVDRTFDMN